VEQLPQLDDEQLPQLDDELKPDSDLTAKAENNFFTLLLLQLGQRISSPFDWKETSFSKNFLQFWH
jgi:hypothetical protein